MADLMDDPNRQAVGLEPAWVEGTGGSDNTAVSEPKPKAKADDDDAKARAKAKTEAEAKTAGEEKSK